jgi:hypothetical protein
MLWVHHIYGSSKANLGLALYGTVYTQVLQNSYHTTPHPVVGRYIAASVADPGCFIPDPGTGSENCFIPDPTSYVNME